MPPRLALFLGIVFCLWVFLTDRKRHGHVSRDLLWPTIWYMAVASRLLGVWLQIWGVPMPGNGGDATDGSIVDRMFFLVLTIIGLVILSRRRFNWSATLRFNPCIVALLAFMFVSIVWSDYPFVSFKRYIKVVGSVVMAMLILTSDRPLESTFAVLRRCLYVHLPMSIICIKYFRAIGVAYDWDGSMSMWQGISTSKNTLGQVAMLGALYFFWEVQRNWRTQSWRQINVLYLAMAVYLLKGAEGAVSLTSVSTCALSLTIFLRLRALRGRPDKARRFAQVVFLGTVSLISLVIVHSIVMFSEDSLFGQLITKFGRNITLTDRTYIWHDVYAAASRNPLLGVGFGGFWIGREANIPWDATKTWVLAQAHSGYVDTYLQIGAIGCLLLAVVLFTTLPRLLTAMEDDHEFGCFRIALFLTIMYTNITESSYLRGDHNLWFVLQLIIWQLPPDALPVRPLISGQQDDEADSSAPIPALSGVNDGDQSAHSAWVRGQL